MTTFSRPLKEPVLMLAALAYSAVLLVQRHMAPDVIPALTVGGIGLMTIAVRPYWGLHVFRGISG